MKVYYYLCFTLQITIYHFKSLSGLNNSRPGIVHRLDKDTSGVIAIAKSDKSHQRLSKQFSDRTVKKVYNYQI